MKPSLSTPPEQIAASLYCINNLILLFLLGLDNKKPFPLPHGLGIFPDAMGFGPPDCIRIGVGLRNLTEKVR